MVSLVLANLRRRVKAGDGFEVLEGEVSGVDCGDAQGDAVGVSMSDTLSRTDTPEVPGRFSHASLFLGTRWALGGGGRHGKGARGMGNGSA